jgi:hypothetical protein
LFYVLATAIHDHVSFRSSSPSCSSVYSKRYVFNLLAGNERAAALSSLACYLATGTLVNRNHFAVMALCSRP